MANEVGKFDQLGESWWNIDDGEFKLLHKINPLRIEFIKHLNLMTLYEFALENEIA